VREAFGKGSCTDETHEGCNSPSTDIRSSLLMSVDEVTGVMKDVIIELVEEVPSLQPSEKYAKLSHDLDSIMDELQSAGAQNSEPHPQPAVVRVY